MRCRLLYFSLYYVIFVQPCSSDKHIDGFIEGDGKEEPLPDKGTLYVIDELYGIDKEFKEVLDYYKRNPNVSSSIDGYIK